MGDDRGWSAAGVGVAGVVGPGVAGVVGSGARQHPRLGQAQTFSSLSPMSKMASSAYRSWSEAVCSHASRATDAPKSGPGGGAWSKDRRSFKTGYDITSVVDRKVTHRVEKSKKRARGA